MALPETPLSIISTAIANQIRTSLNTGEAVNVEIGSPAAVAPAPTDSAHRLSLFFYRFEPAVGVPNQEPGAPLWLRVHCIITAFAAPDDKPAMGQNELRLIGTVLKCFHEKPRLLIELPGAAGADLQKLSIEMIPAPLTLDDINRLWSTQRDVAYRPSIAYEVALVPVLPSELSVAAPPVQIVQAEVRPEVRSASGGRK